MKKWNKTILYWAINTDNPQVTKLPVLDSTGAIINYYKLTSMDITSVFPIYNHRKACVSLTLSSGYREDSKKNISHDWVFSQFLKLDDRVKGVANITDAFDLKVRINVDLKKGDEFCETAINMARLVLQEILENIALAEYMLGAFVIYQETYIYTDRGAVKFDQYLRKKLNLERNPSFREKRQIWDSFSS